MVFFSLHLQQQKFICTWMKPYMDTKNLTELQIPDCDTVVKEEGRYGPSSPAVLRVWLV